MRSTKSPSWIERLLGTTPAPAPPHVFAVDESRLRYGCFERSVDGWSFQAGRSEELPADIFAEGPLGGPLHEVRPFWELLHSFIETLPGPINDASLVVPDSWLRLAFMESDELPRWSSSQDEILRFKLKRKVPYRVEELRISATKVTPFPGQEEPTRLLVGFGVEQLLAQLEEAFAGVGVHIGQITNSTLALLSSLDEVVEAKELTALVMVEQDFYTISYLAGGEPVLYRFKAVNKSLVDSGAVRRDLRLTTNFIHEHLSDMSVDRVFVATPSEDDSRWLDWVGDELERTPETLTYGHFGIDDMGGNDPADGLDLATAQLLGGAAVEVI